MNIEVKQDCPLYEFLKTNIEGKSKNNIKSLLKNGVYVNDKYITKYDYKLKKGDIIKLIFKKINNIEILYEDNDFIVINKPSGLLTISTEKEKKKTVYHILLEYLKKKKQKLFILHRLDKDTSGIMIFCKNEDLRNKIQNNWHKVIRKYVAIVNGKLKEKNGIYEDYLNENKAHKVYVTNNKSGSLAITKYKVLKEKQKFSLIQIEILTGKKNQIRVQMSEHGNYILGDNKYSEDYKNYKRLYLHATSISFIHPETRQKLSFEIPISPSFHKLIKGGKYEL